MGKCVLHIINNNNILNIVPVFRVQQHLASKHLRLRDSKLAECGVLLVTTKTTKKKQEDLSIL